MGRYIDLTGQRFNRLMVVQKTENRKNNQILWLCKCDCGNYKELLAKDFKYGAVKSCGCLKQESDKKPKGNVKDLIGKQFNKLTVIERKGSDGRGEARWLCSCECGNQTIVLGSNLRSGHTQSCGCERRSHGELVVAQLLKDNNIQFQQEVNMFKYSTGANAKFDFYVNNSYLIEYDGETHYLYNLHRWHNKEQLKVQQERDMIKNQWCKENNIPLIRIPYTHLKDLCIEDLLLDTSSFVWAK